MNKAEIPALTGIRGAAASLVVVYHYYASDIPAGPAHAFIGRGYLWVDLFFVLSGFVLALNYARLFEDGFSRQAYGTFLMRRVARIYPLYFTVMLARLLYTAIVYGGFHVHGTDGASVVLQNPAEDIVANLLLVQAWRVSGSVIGTGWSVSTEAFAYLVFPLLVACTLFGSRRTAIISGIPAIALLFVVVAIDAHDGAYHSGALDAWNGREIGPVLRCLAEVTLGLLTFRIAGMRAVRRIAAHDVTGLAVIAALLALFTAGAPDLTIVAAFTALVLCLSLNRGLPARLFANRVMLWLGMLSYAIYLLHPCVQPLLPVLERDFGTVLPRAAALALSGVVMAALVLACSAFAYRAIEAPGRKLIRGIADARFGRANRASDGLQERPASS